MKKLQINLLTGTAWTKSIIVEGDLQGDILQYIDDYYSENGDLPVAMYELEELEDYEIETFIPINGGEFFIQGINSIEEI